MALLVPVGYVIFIRSPRQSRGLGILVYHTGKEKIEVPIKQIFGFRGAI
jgi:hypothetical protein